MRENGTDVGRRRGDEYIWLEVEKYEPAPAKFSLLVIEKIGEKSYVLAENLKNYGVKVYKDIQCDPVLPSKDVWVDKSIDHVLDQIRVLST